MGHTAELAAVEERLDQLAELEAEILDDLETADQGDYMAAAIHERLTDDLNNLRDERAELVGAMAPRDSIVNLLRR